MADIESWLPWLVLVFTLITIVMLLVPTPYGVTDDVLDGKRRNEIRVQVLVLGDIGRSPRMQYHALSIAKHGGRVDLIGYKESDVHPQIVSSPSITVHPISPSPDFLNTKSRSLFLISGPLKVIFQIIGLWIVLGYKVKPAKWMLVQNPPSIPTLFVAQIICFLRNTRLVIDWHNFGYSILALKLGDAHPLVWLSRLYERAFSRSAAAHFTVTNVMAKILRQDYRMKSPVIPLHDRPASSFQPLGTAQRLTFLRNLPETASRIDEFEKGKLKLVVSSTSWTPDEDFSLLLEALKSYSELAITTHPHLPEILAIITGKGPQKADFIAQIKDLDAQGKLEMVDIQTIWLSNENYASLLGAADLGVSLHMSSSGVDLPMKVVDMFGAGLPVVGWGRFEAWPELVKEGENGMSFGNAADLQEILVDLFGGDEKKLQILRAGARREGQRRWDDEWDPVAGKLFELP